MKLDRLCFGICILFTILSTWMLGCEPGTIAHRCDSPWTCPLPEPRPASPKSERGEPAEESPQTPDVSATDEPIGSALIPAPVVGDAPGYLTVTPAPVIPSGCTAGEVEDWGEDARNIRIAGSSTGYAVAYDSDMTHVRMVAPDGTPTSPDGILPPWMANAGWPEIGSGRDGYIVVAAVSGSAGPGIYTMGQDGAIKSSVLSALRQNTTAVQILGGSDSVPDTLVWETWGDGVASNVCIMQSALSSTSLDSQPLMCQYITGGWWWQLTAAARGETSTAFAVIAGDANDYFNNAVEVWVVGSFGSKMVRVSDTFRSSTRALRMIAVPGGYAVLVERNADVNNDGNLERAAFLAFIGEDGELQRMTYLPQGVTDFAWNGADFGAIGWKNTGHIEFYLVGATGEVKQTLTIAPSNLGYWNVPKIAASLQGFALIWTDWIEPTLKFATVSCQ